MMHVHDRQDYSRMLLLHDKSHKNYIQLYSLARVLKLFVMEQ